MTPAPLSLAADDASVVEDYLAAAKWKTLRQWGIGAALTRDGYRQHEASGSAAPAELPAVQLSTRLPDVDSDSVTTGPRRNCSWANRHPDESLPRPGWLCRFGSEQMRPTSSAGAETHREATVLAGPR